MGVPQEVLDRLFDVDEVIGLILRESTQDSVFGLKVRSQESTTLKGQSLGAASAQASAGTGFSQIQDANSRFLLQPSQQGYIYQCFWGVHPSYARIYIAYPPQQNRGGLVVPITIGGPFGFLDGVDAFYSSASRITEFFTMYGGLQPAFNGYNPNGLPASVTIYMNFWIWKYSVDLVSIGGPGDPPVKRTIPVGGTPPADAPQWLLAMRDQQQIRTSAASVRAARAGATAFSR